MRRAAPLPLDASIVRGCLDVELPTDALFLRGWTKGRQVFTTRERARVAGVTGHVAESVTEVLLDELGWHPLWHHVGPGPHGVDLVMLTAAGNVVAVEVKGTLVPGRIPRLARRELAQMSTPWMDKRDNPGMVDLDLTSEDVFGAVVVINFADLTFRAATTRDFVDLQPVASIDDLADEGWAVPPS